MSVSAAELRASAARIIRDERLKERDRWINLWNFILVKELEAGTTFLRTRPDDQLFAALGTTHEVVALPERGGEAWHAYFHSTYGFAKREKVSGFIYDTIRAYAWTHGQRVELRRFAAYRADTKTAFISAYDGHIFKIEGSEKITIEPQGVDDVYFADDHGGQAIKPDIGPHGMLLPRLTQPNFLSGDSIKITPEQQRMALTIWLFAVAFPDLLQTKPVLLLEGQRGSGKTSIVVHLQLVLFGSDRPISLREDKEDDFGIQLLRNPIALLDNQDTYLKWLANAICAYATGGVWEKRKLYTDDQNVIIKPHAFVAFTTRNPASFRRDDVIDRCVILRFDRRTSFADESELKAEVLADRAKLLGEYLWYVGRIVDVLRDESLQLKSASTYRMAAFVSFGRAVAHVMGWSVESLEAMLRAMEDERTAFLMEEEPVVDLLGAWLDYEVDSRYKRPSNKGRLIDVFDLANELEWLGDGIGRPFTDSPRILAQKLKSPPFEAAFRIQQYKLNGHPAFRIWRKTDPVLEVIDGGTR